MTKNYFLFNCQSWVTTKRQITHINENKELVNSHIKKAKHNLEFFKLNKKHNNFNDWLIVVLYYTLYHCALALITNKRYASKNHYATLILLIKEYQLTKEEVILLNQLSINKDDAELYTNLKEDRHNASYATYSKFDKEIITDYENQVFGFIQKTEELIQND